MVKRGCSNCGPVEEPTDVRILRRKNWTKDWVKESSPGDLLLLEGPQGKSGGILRLRSPGMFLVLDALQVWAKKRVVWPVRFSRIKSFRIMGTTIEYAAQ